MTYGLRLPCSVMLLASVLSTAAGAASDAVARSGSVRGVVELSLPGAALPLVGPIVVYLDPIGDPGQGAPPLESARIAQKGARFAPPFRVVSVGQRVDMPNADAIYHNVFSYSRPNAFDLGMYPAGASRSVVFEHPGVVKTYCSIHESMNGTILVLPSRHFSMVGASGRFSIEGVPPGRYRLRTWCEKLPDTAREITVGEEGPLRFTISLVPQGT